MNRQERHRTESFLLFIILMIFSLALMLLMNSCSVERKIQWHLKQSERHLNKAISKGYKPLINKSEIDKNISIRLNQEFKNNLPKTIINQIELSKDELGIIRDSILVDNIIRLVQEVPKYVRIDSLIVLYDNNDSVGYLSIKSDSTGLNVKYEAQTGKTVFIELNPLEWAFKKLGINKTVGLIVFWLIIIILLILLIYKNIPSLWN